MSVGVHRGFVAWRARHQVGGEFDDGNAVVGGAVVHGTSGIAEGQAVRSDMTRPTEGR